MKGEIHDVAILQTLQALLHDALHVGPKPTLYAGPQGKVHTETGLYRGVCLDSPAQSQRKLEQVTPVG